METLFTILTQAVEGSAVVAFGAAILWGILSVVLSPCHLSSIPLIVGFIGGQGKISTARAFWTATFFSTGILITIAVIGIVTSAAGRMLGDIGAWGNYLVAIVLFAVGLFLFGILPAPWSGLGNVGMRSRGLLAALILGLVFGIALGPCTFAYMAPVLAITFHLAKTHAIQAAVMLLAYGVGHCSVIVLAGTSTELVQRYLDWNENSKGIAFLKYACGVLVILGGIYLIYAAP